jgi:hypothetical protein
MTRQTFYQFITEHPDIISDKSAHITMTKMIFRNNKPMIEISLVTSNSTHSIKRMGGITTGELNVTTFNKYKKWFSQYSMNKDKYLNNRICSSDSDIYMDLFFHPNTNVYVAINEHTKLFKIGYTKNLQLRIRQLELQSGSNIDVIECNSVGLHQPLTMIEVEKKLHDKYSEYRSSGEWFKFNDDILTECVYDLMSLTEFGELYT